MLSSISELLMSPFLNNLLVICFSECKLTFEDEIKWHQFITGKNQSKVAVYLCRDVFQSPGDLLSALNKTQLAPSHAGVWGRTVSFTELGDASVETPWCGGQRTFCVGGSSLRLFTSKFYVIHERTHLEKGNSPMRVLLLAKSFWVTEQVNDQVLM